MNINNNTVIAANRFGLGARPGELGFIGDGGREWLAAQIQGGAEVPAAMVKLPGSVAAARQFGRFSQMQREALHEDDAKSAMEALSKQDFSPFSFYRRHAVARSVNAVTTKAPFRERLVQFWSNHFAVSTNAQRMWGLTGPFEIEAVRPNICGSFYELLLAVEQHPAMLVFLNNDQSIGPDSRFAVRHKQRDFGINENLGRETLELHTLGVNGGYTQADVIELAKAITGWGVGGFGADRKQAVGRFYFNPALHEPGSRTVLGKVYPEGGVEQGEAVLRDLARHPATARHIATKLVRHFVSDAPPAACVARITGAFQESDGHLPSVYRALIDSEEAWREARSKYKTPQDLVYSAFRALNFMPRNPNLFLRDFNALGQSPWQPGSPAGWPDTEAAWAGSDSLYSRLQFAGEMAARMGSRAEPEYLAVSVLGPTVSDTTMHTIRQAESAQQGVALLLSSPEFQRR